MFQQTKFTEVLRDLIVSILKPWVWIHLGNQKYNKWTSSLVSCWNVFNVYLLLHDFVCFNVLLHWVDIWNVFQYRTCRMRSYRMHRCTLVCGASWNIWKGSTQIHQDSRFTNYVAIDSVEMVKPGITFSRLCIGNVIKVAGKKMTVLLCLIVFFYKWKCPKSVNFVFFYMQS